MLISMKLNVFVNLVELVQLVLKKLHPMILHMINKPGQVIEYLMQHFVINIDLIMIKLIHLKY